MKNKNDFMYTFKHRLVVIYLANKYISTDKVDLLERIKKHDVDKLFNYMFYDKKTVSKMHRLLSSHHDNEIAKTYEDYVEMVLDWESARYTKSDKPLNAYDTLYKYYPYMEDNILPILREFKIDKSNLVKESDVIEYVNSINVTLEDIKEFMNSYINDYFNC